MFTWLRVERRRMRENIEFAPPRHMLALPLTPEIRSRLCKTVSVCNGSLVLTVGSRREQNQGLERQRA